MTKRLLVMAGGTGGHVFPGLAVAKMLLDDGWQVQWLGCATRMEATLVPKHNIKINFIDVEGVRGNGIIRLLKAPFKLLRSVWQARRIIKQYKPDVILGMGGFASGPGGIAAKLCGIPLVLHEQNAIAGLTNRYLAKIASKVLVAFESALVKHQPAVVGNPVRQDILALGTRCFSAKKTINLLVVGGSLGARALNETLPLALGRLANKDVVVRHQVGKDNSAAVSKAYDGHQNVEVFDFIDDMAASYAWADIVVCRAGALTVSEIAVLGLPAIFVPLPYAVDDHQTKNATVLANVNAAVIMPQASMTAESLAAKIDQIISTDALASMTGASRSLAKTDATKQVADVCCQLAGLDIEKSPTNPVKSSD